MTATTEPRSGILYGWELGERNWNQGMDANLLRLGRFGFHLSAISRNLSAPPGTPAAGDAYIIAASPTGDWAGRAAQIAVWDGAAWAFGAPSPGWMCYVEEEGALAAYTAGGWIVGVLLPDNILAVRSVNDLPDPVGDESVLPAKEVWLLDDINLGTDALRLSTGTLLRGFGGRSITSGNANGIIRATNLAEAVVLREFSVVATGGPCLNLVGDVAHQLNLFFLGLIGAAPGTSVGEVSGYDVQAFKDCYFNAPDGVRVVGSPNKVFFSQCPFYGIGAGNAGVTFGATLNALRVDMVNNFFKHGATGIPMRAEAGYTVGYGRVNGTMLEGPTQPLDGFAASDPNWWFQENDLIPNSRIAGQDYLTAPFDTPITTVGEFVPIAGSFALRPLSQRLTLDGNNDLVLGGNQPGLVTVIANLSINPSNNNRLAFRITKNGEDIAATEVIAEQGAGAGAYPRPVNITGLVAAVPGDAVGVAVANLMTMDDVPFLAATKAVAA